MSIFNKKLLVTQSFIADGPKTYWDYRDYIFSFCSNLSIKDQVFRLNLERDTKWLPEFRSAARYNNFSNFLITSVQPDSWASYMIQQIEENKTIWTMPFPGDHIYINDDQKLLVNLLDKAEKIGVDAVAYSHIHDWDYLLDWKMIKKVYEDKECIVINWGHKYKFYRNRLLVRMALRKVHQFIIIPPVPGYLIYKSNFLLKILNAIPYKTRRWQDMEYSPAKEASKFTVLIPKKCLYRHVHGYWIELFLKNKDKGLSVDILDENVKSMYIRSNYNWKENKPSIDEYRQMVLDKNNYFKKYFLDILKQQIFSTGIEKSKFSISSLVIVGKILFYRYLLIYLSIIKKFVKKIFILLIWDIKRLLQKEQCN